MIRGTGVCHLCKTLIENKDCLMWDTFPVCQSCFNKELIKRKKSSTGNDRGQK